MCPGLRIDGNIKEPQITKDNNAAKYNFDLENENNWFSIGSDGSFTQLGNGIKYSTAITSPVSIQFSTLALTTASYYHKALGIVPIDATDHQLAKYLIENLNNNTIMNLCCRGGAIGDKTILNSIFNARFNKINYDEILSDRGFRVAYYKP